MHQQYQHGNFKFIKTKNVVMFGIYKNGYSEQDFVNDCKNYIKFKNIY